MMIPIVILLMSIFSVIFIFDGNRLKKLKENPRFLRSEVCYLIECFSLAQQNPRVDLIITTTRRFIIIELNLRILSLCLFYFVQTDY